MIALAVAFAALGALVLTAVQTIPSISLGAPSTNNSEITVPISIRNQGPLSFENLSVAVSVQDKSGANLFTGSGGPVSITPGSTESLTVSVPFDLGKIPQAELSELATTNQELLIKATLEGALPPLASLVGSISTTLPWGALIENFSIGSESIMPLNLTYAQVTVPLSFTNNNSYVPISGTGAIRILDHRGTQVGSGTLNVSAPVDSTFHGDANLVMALPSNATSLLFIDENLTYNAIMQFTSQQSQSQIALNKTITIEWKAPLSNLTIGAPDIRLYNSTRLQVTTPISFQNSNDFVDITPTLLTAKISNSSTGQQIGAGSIMVSAPHDAPFKGNLTSYLALDNASMNSLLFNDRTLNFNVLLSGSYSGSQFSLSRNLSVDWGAPLFGFSEGNSSLSSFNSTDFLITTPVSFENHSPYINLYAPLSAVLENSSSLSQEGTGTINLQVPPGANFSGALQIYTKMPRQYMNTLLFNDENLSYRVLLSSTVAKIPMSLVQLVQVHWGALVKTPEFGTFSVRYFNSTYSSINIGFNFTNSSPFLALVGNVSGTILDQSGTQVGTISNQPIGVNESSFFSGQLSGFLSLGSASQRTLILHLVFQTAYGVGVEDVTVNA